MQILLLVFYLFFLSIHVFYMEHCFSLINNGENISRCSRFRITYIIGRNFALKFEYFILVASYSLLMQRVTINSTDDCGILQS